MQLTESACWWKVTMISHGVEIAIAGGVGKMVRAHPLGPFLFFFFFFFYILYSLLRYKNSHVALAIA